MNGTRSCTSNTPLDPKPPVMTEDDIQAQLNAEKHDGPEEEAPTSARDDVESPSSFSSTSSSNGSSHTDDPNDMSYHLPLPPKLPLSSIRVYDIESELNLTRAESDQLYNLMRASMKRAGLLGTMTFMPAHRKANKEALHPIFAAIREKLIFLNEKARKGVGLGRLAELLRARAMRINENEKHNQWVRKSKVEVRNKERGDTDTEEVPSHASTMVHGDEVSLVSTLSEVDDAAASR